MSKEWVKKVLIVVWFHLLYLSKAERHPCVAMYHPLYDSPSLHGDEFVPWLAGRFVLSSESIDLKRRIPTATYTRRPSVGVVAAVSSGHHYRIADLCDFLPQSSLSDHPAAAAVLTSHTVDMSIIYRLFFRVRNYPMENRPLSDDCQLENRSTQLIPLVMEFQR
ncbi:hypothetical protein V3C99_002536 [Haemonchus contortus]